MTDEERPQLHQLKALLGTIPSPDTEGSALAELMYTASENGLIYNMSSVDAVIIWKLVELAKSFGDTCPQELRM